MGRKAKSNILDLVGYFNSKNLCYQEICSLTASSDILKKASIILFGYANEKSCYGILRNIRRNSKNIKTKFSKISKLAKDPEDNTADITLHVINYLKKNDFTINDLNLQWSNMFYKICDEFQLKKSSKNSKKMRISVNRKWKKIELSIQTKNIFDINADTDNVRLSPTHDKSEQNINNPPLIQPRCESFNNNQCSSASLNKSFERQNQNSSIPKEIFPSNYDNFDTDFENFANTSTEKKNISSDFETIDIDQRLDFIHVQKFCQLTV